MEKANKVCIKCGYDDTNLVYIGQGQSLHSRGTYDILKESGYICDEARWSQCKTTSGVIFSTCRTCQYSWAQKTSDAKYKRGSSPKNANPNTSSPINEIGEAEKCSWEFRFDVNEFGNPDWNNKYMPTFEEDYYGQR